MNTLPTSLKPDAAAWVQAQLALNHARASAAAQCRIEAVDQWAQDIFVALRDVLLHLITDQPELGRYLAADWRIATARFEAIEAGQPAREDESLDLLEARRLLYNDFIAVGLMPRR